jgi:hypothetical protein
MTPLEELIEDYKRKIKSLSKIVINSKDESNEKNRLEDKLGTYRAFLLDLERTLALENEHIKEESIKFAENIKEKIKHRVFPIDFHDVKWLKVEQVFKENIENENEKRL